MLYLKYLSNTMLLRLISRSLHLVFAAFCMVLYVLFSPRSFMRSLYDRLCKYKNVSATTKHSSSSSVDPQEVKKFNSRASEWWQERKFCFLREMNSLRVPLIRNGILSVAGSKPKTAEPLKGYNILDVGCGGGILSEALAKLGASVTGLDPGSESIQAAIDHASQDPDIKERLNYICDTVENLALSSNQYDAIVCSEVVEHVNNVQTIVQSCVELTKENGSLFFTTFNRTPTSYVVGILLAEYILGLIPKGTHEYNKFVPPSDLIKILESLNCRIVSVQGSIYNPVTQKFSWCKSDAVMYALHAVK